LLPLSTVQKYTTLGNKDQKQTSSANRKSVKIPLEGKVITQKRERGTGGLFKMKGSRFWYAQFYDRDGKPRRASTKEAVKAKAQGVLRRMMSDSERGLPFQGDVRKIHYADLRAALLHNYAERGNKSLETYSDGEETIWGLKAVDTFFKGMPVSKITTDKAREFASGLLAQGAANGTVNRSLALLRRMLNLAKEDGKIQIVPKIRMMKAGPARKGFLPREQFDDLVAKLPIHLKPLVVFLYYCGVRVGEALQIEWSQVDLKGAVIRLEQEQTKADSARTVPLPDVLLGMLESQEPKEGLVFDGTNLRKGWQTACEAAGLGKLEKVEGKRDKRYTGLLIHDLRRSAIRNLVRAGVPERVAMAISGHKTRAVFDRYNITSEQDVVEAMRKLQGSSESSVQVSPQPRRLNK
jgi:integrase